MPLRQTSLPISPLLLSSHIGLMLYFVSCCNAQTAGILVRNTNLAQLAGDRIITGQWFDTGRRDCSRQSTYIKSLFAIMRMYYHELTISFHMPCFWVHLYIFISPKKWYSGKNTYNIIIKENTISKYKVNMTIISIVKNVTINLQSILKWFTSTHKFFIFFPEIF